MRKVMGYVLIAAGFAVPRAPAQSLLDAVNSKSGETGGLHLYGISIFSGYSSSAYPLAGGGVGSAPNVTSIAGMQALGSDVNYGASASLGWRHSGKRTNFSALYSGTYGGMVRYSDLNAFSHTLSISASRELRPKWTLTVTGSGQDSTMAQYIFEPTSLAVISQVPSTFDDLAAAFSIGRFSNAQIASMLTGAPMLESPARSLLLGDRILSYSAQASLTYVRSSRLSFHFGSLAAGGQSRPGGQSGTQPDNTAVMPRSLGASAGVGLSYSLSPRTQVGVSVEGLRLTNHFQSTYTTTATASLGRKMGMHWFLSLNAGGSAIAVTQQLYGTPPSRQAVGSGSIGFRTYQHTLVASYGRTSADTYGFAAGTNTTANGNWNWHRPGSRWTTFASFGQQQMRNTGFASISGWQASGGTSASLYGNMTLTAQYVYLSSTGDYFARGTTSLALHSIRVSLNWAPQSAQR